MEQIQQQSRRISCAQETDNSTSRAVPNEQTELGTEVDEQHLKAAIKHSQQAAKLNARHQSVADERRLESQVYQKLPSSKSNMKGNNTQREQRKCASKQECASKDLSVVTNMNRARERKNTKLASSMANNSKNSIKMVFQTKIAAHDVKVGQNTKNLVTQARSCGSKEVANLLESKTQSKTINLTLKLDDLKQSAIALNERIDQGKSRDSSQSGSIPDEQAPQDAVNSSTGHQHSSIAPKLMRELLPPPSSSRDIRMLDSLASKDKKSQQHKRAQSLPRANAIAQLLSQKQDGNSHLKAVNSGSYQNESIILKSFSREGPLELDEQADEPVFLQPAGRNDDAIDIDSSSAAVLISLADAGIRNTTEDGGQPVHFLNESANNVDQVRMQTTNSMRSPSEPHSNIPLTGISLLHQPLIGSATRLITHHVPMDTQQSQVAQTTNQRATTIVSSDSIEQRDVVRNHLMAKAKFEALRNYMMSRLNWITYLQVLCDELQKKPFKVIKEPPSQPNDQQPPMSARSAYTIGGQDCQQGGMNSKKSFLSLTREKMQNDQKKRQETTVVHKVSRDALVKALSKIQTLLPLMPKTVYIKKHKEDDPGITYDRVINLLLSQPLTWLLQKDIISILMTKQKKDRARARSAQMVARAKAHMQQSEEKRFSDSESSQGYEVRDEQMDGQRPSQVSQAETIDLKTDLNSKSLHSFRAALTGAEGQLQIKSPSSNAIPSFQDMSEISNLHTQNQQKAGRPGEDNFATMVQDTSFNMLLQLGMGSKSGVASDHQNPLPILKKDDLSRFLTNQSSKKSVRNNRSLSMSAIKAKLYQTPVEKTDTYDEKAHIQEESSACEKRSSNESDRQHIIRETQNPATMQYKSQVVPQITQSKAQPNSFIHQRKGLLKVQDLLKIQMQGTSDLDQLIANEEQEDEEECTMWMPGTGNQTGATSPVHQRSPDKIIQKAGNILGQSKQAELMLQELHESVNQEDLALAALQKRHAERTGMLLTSATGAYEGLQDLVDENDQQNVMSRQPMTLKCASFGSDPFAAARQPMSLALTESLGGPAEVPTRNINQFPLPQTAKHQVNAWQSNGDRVQFRCNFHEMVSFGSLGANSKPMGPTSGKSSRKGAADIDSVQDSNSVKFWGSIDFTSQKQSQRENEQASLPVTMGQSQSLKSRQQPFKQSLGQQTGYQSMTVLTGTFASNNARPMAPNYKSKMSLAKSKGQLSDSQDGDADADEDLREFVEEDEAQMKSASSTSNYEVHADATVDVDTRHINNMFSTGQLSSRNQMKPQLSKHASYEIEKIIGAVNRSFKESYVSSQKSKFFEKAHALTVERKHQGANVAKQTYVLREGNGFPIRNKLTNNESSQENYCETPSLTSVFENPLQSLLYLNISFCKVNSLKALLVSHEGALTCPSLRFINASNNLLTEADNLPISEQLLSYNMIKRADGLPLKLYLVDLSFNRICSLEDLPQAVTHLCVQGNPIEAKAKRHFEKRIAGSRLQTSLIRDNQNVMRSSMLQKELGKDFFATTRHYLKKRVTRVHLKSDHISTLTQKLAAPTESMSRQAVAAKRTTLNPTNSSRSLNKIAGTVSSGMPSSPRDLNNVNIDKKRKSNPNTSKQNANAMGRLGVFRPMSPQGCVTKAPSRSTDRNSRAALRAKGPQQS